MDEQVNANLYDFVTSSSSTSKTTRSSDHNSSGATQHDKIYRRQLSQRISTDEDKNISSSSITQKKIERYFGKVKYCQSDVKLPNHGDSSEVINVILATMKEELNQEGIDLSLPASYDELHKLVQDNTPENIYNLLKKKQEVLAGVLNTMITTSPGEHESRSDWYQRLHRVVEAKQSSPDFHCNCKFRDLGIIRMLTMLSGLCSEEVSNHHWARFWVSLISDLDGARQVHQDGTVSRGKFVNNEECEAQMIIIPQQRAPDDDDSDGDTWDGPAVNITVKPDFMLCSTKGTLHQDTPKRIALVGEIKGSLHEDFTSSECESDSSCCSTAKRNRITNENYNSSDSLNKLDKTSGIRKDRDRMNAIKTQHFTDLLCMMKLSHLKRLEYLPCGDHMFGWYSVLDKVYITCLVAQTNIQPYAFILFDRSSSYHQQNKEGSLFKQFCFPPFELFKPEHFKALCYFVNYLVWVRK